MQNNLNKSDRFSEPSAPLRCCDKTRLLIGQESANGVACKHRINSLLFSQFSQVRRHRNISPSLKNALAMQISYLSRMLGLNPRFQTTLVHLLDLGYKCRLRLPLFISAGFFLCHLFSNYIPRVEINVQVIEEEGDEEADELVLEGEIEAEAV